MSTTIPHDDLAEEVARLREQLLDLGQEVAGLGQEITRLTAQARADALAIEVLCAEAAGQHGAAGRAPRRHGMHLAPEVAR